MTDSRLECECGHVGSRHGHDRQSCAAVGCDCQGYRRHRYAQAIAESEAIAAHRAEQDEVTS